MEDDQGQEGDASTDPTVWTSDVAAAPAAPSPPAPPEAPTFAPGTPPWARAGGSIAANPGVVNPAVLPGPQPWGAPTGPPMPGVARNPAASLTQNPAGWSSPSAVPAPGSVPAGFPGATGAFGPAAAMPTAATVPTPYAPPRKRIGPLGIPPMLALSTMIQAVPALLAVGYGIVIIFAGFLVEQQRDSFGSAGNDVSDVRNVALGLGVVCLCIGLAGTISVILMAGGHRIGRILCTIWLALDLVVIAIGSVTSMDRSDGFTIAGGLLGVVPALIALVGMWTPKSSEIF